MSKGHRAPTFSGLRHEWLYLIKSWGDHAAQLMAAHDDGARYSAALAMRFMRHSGLFQHIVPPMRPDRTDPQ